MKNTLTENKSIGPAKYDANAQSPAVDCLKYWMTRKQIAARYQVSLRCVDTWKADGRIPSYKIGHLVRFNPAECDQALRKFWFPSQINTH